MYLKRKKDGSLKRVMEQRVTSIEGLAILKRKKRKTEEGTRNRATEAGERRRGSRVM